MSGTEDTVERNSEGDDDVTDRTECECQYYGEGLASAITHIATEASRQLRPMATMEPACCIVPTFAPSDNQRKR